MLKGKKIVIGITGSIAAYKIPFLVRLLVREEAQVRVIMTPAATDFVTPLTLATLSKNDVIFHPFDKETGTWKSHVELGTWADLMLFAPVTASTLGKMAHGVADNFLVTAYLSAKCPVFIAPAMDLDMFQHPSTQANITILKSFGNKIIEPQTGELASGLSGPGRMEEPERILEQIHDFFLHSGDLKDKTILVTAGPTFEKIDPVRYIGNHSSGLMGISIAEEAAGRGADVTLVTGPVSIRVSNPLIKVIRVESAGEMHKAVTRNAKGKDVIIMAAAVADYTVKNPSPVKIKKSDNHLAVELVPTQDILAELGKIKQKGQFLVGFALETDHEIENASKKLREKNLDLIILNSLKDKGAGFGGSTNKITMIPKSGKPVPGKLKAKTEIAKEIVSAIVKLMNA
jgi:phosphopantothenoylcysteine decarboxylase / phosphopantothenate---cysteine ligase